MNESLSPFSTQASDASSNRNTPITPAPVSNDTDIQRVLSTSGELQDDNAFQGMLQFNFQFPIVPQNYNSLMSASSFNELYSYYPQFQPQPMVRKQENQSPSVSSSPSSEIKPKRRRTSFNPIQLKKLEATYAENPYPPRNKLEELCKETELTYKVIFTWFKNKRAAARKPLKEQ